MRVARGVLRYRRALVGLAVAIGAAGCQSTTSVLELGEPPAAVRDRHLTGGAAAYDGGGVRWRYLGPETLPSSRPASGRLDPLSTTSTGHRYIVPIGEVSQQAFRDAIGQIVPEIIEDPTVSACSVHVRPAEFRVFLSRGYGDQVAQCQLSYLVEIQGVDGRVLHSKRVKATTEGPFDGATVPPALWDCAYQAAAQWAQEALLSPQVAVALSTREVPKTERIEVDARIVSVSTGQILATASASGASIAEARTLANALAMGLLTNWQSSPDGAKRRLAVVAFTAQGESAKRHDLGPLMADMLTTAIKGIGGAQLEIVERQQFRALLAERDIVEAQLVSNPGIASQLEGVAQLILGSVSHLRQE